MNKTIDNIVKEIFTDGFGNKADHLVLEYPDQEIEGSGYCPGAVKEIIRKQLLGSMLEIDADRLVVVSHADGRLLDQSGLKITLSFQDNGKTLKVFIKYKIG